MERPPISTSEVTMIGSVQHMISLLILHELRAAAAAAAAGPKCLSPEQVKAREDRFKPCLKNLNHQHDVREQQQQQQHLVTCEQAARDMHALSGRALAPWRYYLDRDDSRYPPDITFAECLCKGCLINGREDHDYNSVPLMAPQLVLIKTKCKDGTNTYRVKTRCIEVPVGCTCIRPISGN